MNGHREMLELIPLYALGALEGEEHARVEEHLHGGCDVCRASVLEHEAVAADLAQLFPTTGSDPKRRAELFDRVRKDARRSRRAARRWPSRVVLPLALAASVVALLATGVRVAVNRQTIARLQGQLQVANEDLKRTSRDLSERLAQTQGALTALTSPDTRPVALAGQGEASSARATAFLDVSGGRLLLYVNGLRPPPAGRTYQLWVIVENKPVSLGIFDVDAGGKAHMTAEKLPELRGPITIAVTQEPAGGVPQPTGPMVLAGS